MFFKTTAAEGKSAADRCDAGMASVLICQYTTSFAPLFLCDGSGGDAC